MNQEIQTETTLDEHKPWQYGYSLEFLKKIQAFYDEDYNKHSLSPFSKVKKNDVAKLLHDKKIALYGINPFTSAFVVSQVKVKTKINKYATGTPLGEKLPGDIVLTQLTGDYTEPLKYAIEASNKKSVWVVTFSGQDNLNLLLKESGFSYVGAKISTFSEIFWIWYRHCPDDKRYRQFPGYGTAEHLNIKKVKFLYEIKDYVPEPILPFVQGLKQRMIYLSEFLTYENHYSNYNKDNAWSAISLRGYSADPNFIAKPIEMNKQWQEQHKNETYFIQDTRLLKHFKTCINGLVNPLIESWDNVHRVRLMRLKPGGGELQRHTDQVDPDLGVTLGKLARFHIPIVTNDKVIFTSWDETDHPTDVNMKVGEMWYLDIRKPHRAVNGGDSERIHLVVDIEVTDKLLDVLNT